LLDWGEDKLSLAKKANSISLILVAERYGLDLKHNSKIGCPFPNHKGGRERTASFVFYKETNTYHCFGCKTGKTTIDFVMNMDNLTRDNSIRFLLNEYNTFLDLENDYDDFLDLYVDFSNFVRPMIKDGVNIIEYIKAFDDIVNTRNLTKIQLEKLIFKIKERINCSDIINID
jgi:hypothetical protein